MKNEELIVKNRVRLIRVVLYFSFFILNSPLLSSQTRVIDSLRRVLKMQHDDTAKVNTLNALSAKLEIATAYDSSFDCATTAQELADKLGYRKGFAEALINQANIRKDKGDYTKALNYHLQALSIADELGDKKFIATNLSNIGIMYDYQGDYSKALEYHNKALAIHEKLHDTVGMADNYINIGNIYYNQGDFPKALEFDLNSLAIYRKINNRDGIATDLGNIGLIYDDLGNFSKALDYDVEALNIDIEMGNKAGVALNYANIGAIYDGHGNHDKALEYGLKSLAIYRETGDQDGIALNLINIGDIYRAQALMPKSSVEHRDSLFKKSMDCYVNSLAINKVTGDRYFLSYSYLGIGDIYNDMKNYPLAKKYLDSALVLSKIVGQKPLIKEAYQGLAVMDSATGNHAAELVDYRKFIVYRDSLINETNTKKSVQAEMNYEFAQKQAAEKADQDKKDAVAEQQRKKQVIIRNALLAGFALVLALVFFIFRGYRQKKKAYDIITRQKEEVTKSRKKVMDSINYAQKIQYSLLPSAGEIRKYMADYFVCFMPKDVVSGDFYWFHHTGDCSYMAVVDCTGHGVPGAFMSMLANSFLNEIVIEKRVSDPAEILAQMHEHVFKTLRQQKGDEYSQDGMDISLVVIDHKKGTAKFAGAKNNGFIIDGQKITTLKATPKSIGGLSMIGEVEPTRQFKSEVFEVKKGILLVLTTDGIFDQLNASDEKFGKARFNELVQSLYNVDMQQGQLLAENTVNEWKRNMNQQDDILLLSVKI